MVEKIRSLTPVKTEKKKDSDAKNKSVNSGKLIIDATCAPADISYPTDLGLLSGARVHTEKIIDILYKQIKYQTNKKPRTYRNLARKDYLGLAEHKRKADCTRLIEFLQGQRGHEKEVKLEIVVHL